MNLKMWVSNYFEAGAEKSNGTETNQQIIVANFFSFLGYSVTLLMGSISLFYGDHMRAAVLILAAISFFSCHLILRFKPSRASYKFTANLITSILMILMLYLVFTGGKSNTGPLWIYIVPPVALFFGGMRNGLRNLGVFASIIAIMMFYPDDKLLLAVYSSEFKSRLIYSFLSVSCLFAFYEYSRQRSYKDMQKIILKFEQQARHDPLSNLQNRRGMLEKLNYEYERVKRNQHHMSLMMCDVDHFKKINDKFGHETGDNIIREMAGIFTNSVRKQDIVARWGGEEFLFLLPETNAQEAFMLAEKIRLKIADRKFSFHNKSITLTVSIGIYEVTEETNIEQAISCADKNLYKAKKSGRNRSVMDS